MPPELEGGGGGGGTTDTDRRRRRTDEEGEEDDETAAMADADAELASGTESVDQQTAQDIADAADGTGQPTPPEPPEPPTDEGDGAADTGDGEPSGETVFTNVAESSKVGEETREQARELRERAAADQPGAEPGDVEVTLRRRGADLVLTAEPSEAFVAEQQADVQRRQRQAEGAEVRREGRRTAVSVPGLGPDITASTGGRRATVERTGRETRVSVPGGDATIVAGERRRPDMADVDVSPVATAELGTAGVDFPGGEPETRRARLTERGGERVLTAPGADIEPTSGVGREREVDRAVRRFEETTGADVPGEGRIVEPLDRQARARRERQFLSDVTSGDVTLPEPVGAAVPDVDSPFVQRPATAATRLVGPPAMAAERATPGVESPLVQRPIEAGERTFEFGVETVDEAFPGLDSPFVQRPAGAATEGLDIAGERAREAFPGLESPFVQRPREAAAELVAIDTSEFDAAGVDIETFVTGPERVSGETRLLAAPSPAVRTTVGGEFSRGVQIGGAALAGAAAVGGAARFAPGVFPEDTEIPEDREPFAPELGVPEDREPVFGEEISRPQGGVVFDEALSVPESRMPFPAETSIPEGGEPFPSEVDLPELTLGASQQLQRQRPTSDQVQEALERMERRERGKRRAGLKREQREEQRRERQRERRTPVGEGVSDVGGIRVPGESVILPGGGVREGVVLPGAGVTEGVVRNPLAIPDAVTAETEPEIGTEPELGADAAEALEALSTADASTAAVEPTLGPPETVATTVAAEDTRERLDERIRQRLAVDTAPAVDQQVDTRALQREQQDILQRQRTRLARQQRTVEPTRTVTDAAATEPDVSFETAFPEEQRQEVPPAFGVGGGDGPSRLRFGLDIDRGGEAEGETGGLFARRTEVLPGDPDEVVETLDREVGRDTFDDLREDL